MRKVASIIIITKNQIKYLKQTLPMIFKQIFTDFELIVVDSGLDDGAIDIVKQYPARLIQIRPNQFNYAYAFNQGASISKGEYLVRLSGDAVPKNKYWLINLLKNFKNDKVGGVYSRWLNRSDANLIDKYLTLLTMPNKKKFFDRTPNWSGASGALRRQLWQKYPFDENLDFCEDLDWSRKIQKDGYLIVYEPKSIVYHSHNENIWQASARSFKIIHALLKIYQKKI